MIPLCGSYPFFVAIIALPLSSEDNLYHFRSHFVGAGGIRNCPTSAAYHPFVATLGSLVAARFRPLVQLAHQPSSLRCLYSQLYGE